MQTVTAQAPANIALIKYWGKRDEALMLPTKSSLSITLPGLTTTTTVSKSSTQEDTISIDNKKLSGKDKQKIVSFLNIFRSTYNIHDHFLIDSKNSFPTAAGLASSASGFAALAKGLNTLYNLELSPEELSQLARRGSGSACRSIYKGFALWEDYEARQLFTPDHWPELRVIAVIVNNQEKKVSSRVAMQQTIKTSPLYSQWVTRSEQRIPQIINAIKNKDLHMMGSLAEQDCIEMHACIQTTKPAIDYWIPETRVLMQQVQKLRHQKIPCYFTIDAGPNVKIITLDQHVNQITQVALGEFFCYTLAL
ncbi:diphosphomevalonate decarboxylase [Candidatus Dependentiae bacterium]|nr:diphosphomevalonate decarboxylase [Candidatus Dependentiae bacterium]